MRAFFVDSDHARCLDTRRSTSGGVELLGGGAISWSSRTQATTAEGTSEAEYVVMSEIVKEVLFLRQVQAFIMPVLESNPVDIVEDNQGSDSRVNPSLRDEYLRKNKVVSGTTVCRRFPDELDFLVSYLYLVVVLGEGSSLTTIKKPNIE